MNDPQGHNKNGPGGATVSRRQFLKGTGATAAALASPLPVAFADDKDDKKADKGVGMGPDPMKLQLDVNGKKMTTSVEPRVTLLDALRNYLDVTGCKRVCDRGSCGACTILLEGKPVYSCSMLALEARGKAIRTAESLVTGAKLEIGRAHV